MTAACPQLHIFSLQLFYYPPPPREDRGNRKKALKANSQQKQCERSNQPTACFPLQFVASPAGFLEYYKMSGSNYPVSSGPKSTLNHWECCGCCSAYPPETQVWGCREDQRSGREGFLTAVQGTLQGFQTSLSGVVPRWRFFLAHPWGSLGAYSYSPSRILLQASQHIWALERRPFSPKTLLRYNCQLSCNCIALAFANT